MNFCRNDLLLVTAHRLIMCYYYSHYDHVFCVFFPCTLNCHIVNRGHRCRQHGIRIEAGRQADATRQFMRRCTIFYLLSISCLIDYLIDRRIERDSFENVNLIDFFPKASFPKSILLMSLYGFVRISHICISLNMLCVI